jgi:hypothetical protein
MQNNTDSWVLDTTKWASDDHPRRSPWPPLIAAMTIIVTALVLLAATSMLAWPTVLGAVAAW